MRRSSSANLVLRSALLLLLLLLPLVIFPPRLSTACRQVFSDAGSQPEDPGVPSELGAAAECMPWRVDLWESAAHAALQAGNAEAAVRFLERARLEASRIGQPAEDTLSLQGLQDLAAAYQQTGDSDSALATWKVIGDRTDLSPETAENLIRLYLAQADIPAAIGVWQALAVAQSQGAASVYQFGLLLATQDPETALLYLERAASLDPSLAVPISGLRRAVLGARIADDAAYTLLITGRALASLGRWDLAAEAFRQAVLKRPDYAEAWAYLGEARQRILTANGSGEDSPSDQQDGLVELQTALELDPKSLSAQTFLAVYWLRRSDYERALEAIRQATALAPDNPALTAEMANILAASGDLNTALETYRQAAVLAPYDPAYRRQIVVFSLEFNLQVEQIALPIVRQLLIENPQDPVDLDLMGQVLIKLGDLSSAERFLARALQADPGYAPAYLHLGLAYLLQGDGQSAREQLLLAQSLDPEGPTASQAQRLLEGGAP